MNNALIEKITLENGVRVLFYPDKNSKSASLSIAVGSGSRFENEKNSGVSHFIEHMLFKGTAKRNAKEIAETMDLIGGSYNAFTTKEYTGVYARALDEHLPLALDVLGDMVSAPAIAPEDFETERGVILEEIGMYEDIPEELLIDGIHLAAWPNDMLGANILGTRETISNMSPQTLREYMTHSYTGSRVVCAVSGSFDKECILDKARELLGSLPSGGEPFGAVNTAPVCFGTHLVEKEYEQTHFCLAFNAGCAADYKYRWPRNLLNTIMGGTSSSRLFQRIREELGLAYSVGSTVNAYYKEGIVVIDAAVNPAKDKDALAQTAKVLGELRKNGITQKEFERAKEQRKAAIVLSLEGHSAIAGKMSRDELFYNNIQSEEELLCELSQVTLEEVNEFAKKLIVPENFALCAVGKNLNGEEYRKIVAENIC